MNSSARLLPVVRSLLTQTTRNSSSSVEEVVNPRFARLKKLQQKFGTDDGTLVYLKGGFGDKILYQFTCILTAIGLGGCLHTTYGLIFKN